VQYALLALLALAILGWRVERRRYRRLLDRYNFAVEYTNRFNQLLASLEAGSFDGEAYQWLTMNVDKVQKQMGMIGLIHYRAAFGLYTVPNYPVVLNTLPKIRRGEAERSELDWVHDALIRYIGTLQDPLDRTKAELRNPIVWLRYGVQAVITSPLLIAGWLGFMAYSTVERLSSSPAARLLASLLSLLALLGTVITIVTGWGPFIETIRHWRP